MLYLKKITTTSTIFYKLPITDVHVHANNLKINELLPSPVPKPFSFTLLQKPTYVFNASIDLTAIYLTMCCENQIPSVTTYMTVSLFLSQTLRLNVFDTLGPTTLQAFFLGNLIQNCHNPNNNLSRNLQK